MARASALAQHVEAETEEAFQRALTEATRALEERDLPYVLMGGVGSAALGRPRSTADIDLFVHPDVARAALEALEASGFSVEETDRHWLFKAFKHGVLVDVIFRSAGDIYLDEEMLQRSCVSEYKGCSVRIIPAEDLLVIKAVVAAEHVPHHWYDALAIIASAELDWDYLVARARQHGPRRVLSLLLYAESNDLAVPADAVRTLFATVHPS